MFSPLPESYSRTVPLLLVIGNLLGVGLGYLTTMLLARHLSLTDFETYIGTIATLTLLGSCGEAGFGKYALKTVPVLVANGSHGLLRGYLRFAILGCLMTSLLLGLLATNIEAPHDTGSGKQIALLALIFIPAMSCAGVSIDLLLAFQMPKTATFLARILVPLTTLVLVLVLISQATVTPYRAVICFSMGSVVALVIASFLGRSQSNPLTSGVRPEMQWQVWTNEVISFLVFGFLTSWIFRATLVLMHYLPHGGQELALLTPAFETGCLILLISKSTDKYFQPIMSVIMDSGDWELATRMRRSRYVIITTGVALFMLAITLFGEAILRLYGEQFVSAYASLLLVALGSSVWTVFSLAPTFLLFAGKRRLLWMIFLSHGILLTALTAFMARPFGAAGAATAYAVSVTSLALWSWQFAERHWRQMRRISGDGLVPLTTVEQPVG